VDPKLRPTVSSLLEMSWIRAHKINKTETLVSAEVL